MKIKYLFFILLVLFTGENLRAQWTQVPGPEGGKVNALEEWGNKIYLGSCSGLFFSNNQGLSWQKSPFFKNRAIAAIFSYGDTLVVNYAEASLEFPWEFELKIASSYDQGLSWSTPFVVNNDTGFSGANFFLSGGELIYELNGAIIISHDMGVSWTNPNQPPSNANTYTVASDYILARGNNNHLYYSNDLTQNWIDKGYCGMEVKVM